MSNESVIMNKSSVVEEPHCRICMRLIAVVNLIRRLLCAVPVTFLLGGCKGQQNTDHTRARYFGFVVMQTKIYLSDFCFTFFTSQFFPSVPSAVWKVF